MIENGISIVKHTINARKYDTKYDETVLSNCNQINDKEKYSYKITVPSQVQVNEHKKIERKQKTNYHNPIVSPIRATHAAVHQTNYSWMNQVSTKCVSRPIVRKTCNRSIFLIIPECFILESKHREIAIKNSAPTIFNRLL